MHHRLRSAALLAGIVIAGLGAAAAPAGASPPPTVTVMTHNLYFGTDLGPVINAVLNPASTPNDLFSAVGTAYATAQATNFPVRAAAWADEIAVTHPDMVGLQEAAQWRTGPPFAGNASTDAGDLVQLLLSALAARGLHYELVPGAESTGYDVEAPGYVAGGLADVRLTQHEAILARTDDGLTFSNAQWGQYSEMLTLSGPLGSFPLPWSWASVDVTKSGRTFRFVTTHLDPDVGVYQDEQAHDLLNGPAATTLPVILVGDMNSDANATTITGDPPNTGTYRDFTAGGFTDTWTATRPSVPGATCCEAGDLLNPAPTLDQRIDYVFTRGALTPVLDVLVGNTALERAIFGRWPSDHAGVVATIQLAR
jgi:hypothetical protein